MRLISCHIFGFGALHGDYKFESLTSICEKNGWGKTTLAAFLKAMFYGLATSKTNSIKYDDRRRYAPFESQRFGGSLTFERDGVTYTIERSFDEKSGKGDSVRLLQGVEEIPVPEYGLGQEYFGVDERTFMRTLFLGGDEIENLSDLSAALSSVVDDTDNSNFDRAIKKLDDELTALKAKRGRGGKINTLSAQIVELELRQRELEAKAESLNERRAKISQLKAEKDGLQLSFSIASEGELWDIYDGLIRDITAVEENIEMINAKYPQGIPEGEALSKLEKLCADYRENRAKLARINEKRDGESGRDIAYYVMILAYIVAVGCLAGGIVLALYQNMTMAIVLWSICVAAFAVARGIPMFKKSGYNQLVEEGKRFVHYGELLLDSFGLTGDMIERCADIKSDISTLEKYQKELEIRRDTAEKYKVEKGLSERKEKATPLTGGKVKELDESLLRESSELSILEREVVEIDGVLNSLTNKREELEAANKRYHLLSAALSSLNYAESYLKEKYVTPVHTSFAKYALMLEKNLGLKVRLNKSLELLLEEGGALRRSEHLSKGQLSALSLALRLAIADNIYKDAFIILDDPFVNLDEEHLDKVKELLKELSKDRQIIYLTCHTSRVI